MKNRLLALGFGLPLPLGVLAMTFVTKPVPVIAPVDLK